MSDNFDFDLKLYQAFMSHMEQKFIITIQEPIDGGFSGARTSIVQLEPRDSISINVEKGKYILKVCRAEDAMKEITNHQTAKESPILGKHVPDLIDHSFSYKDRGVALTGILYQIAGESVLNRTTLHRGLELYFPKKQIEEVTRIILKWIAEDASTRGIRIPGTADLLGLMQQDLGEGHLMDLEERLNKICKNLDQPRVDLFPFDSSKYNPLYFLRNLDTYKTLRHIQFSLPRGVLHADLHPGNIIIPIQSESQEPFYIIDFASSRIGNAYFDLAYLEISLLLNSASGFHWMTDLKYWWTIEQLLSSKILPVESEEAFSGVSIEGLRRVLPIRRVLDEHIKSQKKELQENDWIAYLAASIEAGLDLARKVYRDSDLQRVAFLTAISRFHRLIEVLGTVDLPLNNEQPMVAIKWPAQKRLEVSPDSGTEEEKEKRKTASPTSPLRTQKVRNKIELAWPGEINQLAALYDPWKILDENFATLSGGNDQGVLLIGERKFGKSSFFNCIRSLITREGGNLRTVSPDTLGINHTAQSFAVALSKRLYGSMGLQNTSTPYDGTTRDFESDQFFTACQLFADKTKGKRFVICIDEVDATLNTAQSTEDARDILYMLNKLLTDPDLPFRLLLTATDKEIVARLPRGPEFLENLVPYTLPLCLDSEMFELIERFELPIRFEEDAYKSIFKFTGGQIYFVKAVVRACQAQAGEKYKRKISTQFVQDLTHALIAPTSSTSFAIRNIYDGIFLTVTNIYPQFFNGDERRFMNLLTNNEGVLKASSLQVSEAQLANTANTLYRRGYISKSVTEEGEEYQWRIGFWNDFLKNRYAFQPKEE